MFTTTHLDVDANGQKQEAFSNISSHQLRSRDPTRKSSSKYLLSNEESQERQLDLEERGKKPVTRLNIQNTDTNINDQEPKDMLDSDSSDSTNLSSFRCILNEEDPDLDNPNLYNCKTCRKGLIHIRSRRLSPEADHCDKLPFKNNQSSSDLEKNVQNHKHHHLQTQKACLASNTDQMIFPTVKQLPIDCTSVEFDDQQRSNAHHLQDGFSNIDFEESKDVSADENEKRTVCSVREEGFKNQLTWKHLTHKMKIKAKGLFKCKQCPKHFSTNQNLKSHTMVHGTQAEFTCEFCQKGFIHKSRFESHSRIHKTDVEAKCPFKCNKCSKRYPSKRNLDRHMLVHGVQANFICASCSKGFVAKYDLRIHLKIHEINVDDKFSFKCEKCPKHYSKKIHLKTHNMLVHGAEAKFICGICSKGFMTKWPLREHLKIHETNVDVKFPFKCEKCPKQYSMKRDLKEHMLVHGAEAKFICGICSKGFMISHRFRRHLKVHENNVDTNPVPRSFPTSELGP